MAAISLSGSGNSPSRRIFDVLSSTMKKQGGSAIGPYDETNRSSPLRAFTRPAGLAAKERFFAPKNGAQNDVATRCVVRGQSGRAANDLSNVHGTDAPRE